jgi:hypothetical protein
MMKCLRFIVIVAPDVVLPDVLPDEDPGIDLSIGRAATPAGGLIVT